MTVLLAFTKRHLITRSIQFYYLPKLTPGGHWWRYRSGGTLKTSSDFRTDTSVWENRSVSIFTTHLPCTLYHAMISMNTYYVCMYNPLFTADPILWLDLCIVFLWIHLLRNSNLMYEMRPAISSAVTSPVVERRDRKTVSEITKLGTHLVRNKPFASGPFTFSVFLCLEWRKWRPRFPKWILCIYQRKLFAFKICSNSGVGTRKQWGQLSPQPGGRGAVPPQN